MIDRLPVPLLMDGATATNLIQAGMPHDVCPADWILEHPNPLRLLHEEMIHAGSRLIYTPTANANSVMLAAYGREAQVESYNKRLAEQTVAACRETNPHVLVAGCVAPLRIQTEPFGDTPFLELVNIYAQQAFALRDGGVDLLVADTMTSLSQCRAAVMGCRQTGLPVAVTLNIEADGETFWGCDLVSALIVCQSLGAAAFGLSCCDEPKSTYAHLEEMYPYAKIPLIAKPNAGTGSSPGLTPEEMAHDTVGLWQRGAVLVGGCCFTTAAHIAAMAREMERFDFGSVHLPKEGSATICMAGESEPYFLDEFFEQSKPLCCQFEMSDELLEAEKSGVDVVTIQVETVDDAACFARNAHMLRRPVSFLSHQEEALEMALLLYNGRAFVDSNSSIEEEQLKQIAAGYGAILR